MTFLFTDIEASTRLWQERPDEMPQALAEHDEMMRFAIVDNQGYVFATGGDGFAAAFALVTDAVEAAAAWLSWGCWSTASSACAWDCTPVRPRCATATTSVPPSTRRRG